MLQVSGIHEAISTQTHEIEYLGSFPVWLSWKLCHPSTMTLDYAFKVLNQKLTAKIQKLWLIWAPWTPGVPTTFITGCSILKSWLNAETWMDDRLRPCKHISLVSQSHIFIVGISTRVGKQQQHNPTWFLGSNFLFLQINYIKLQCFKIEYHLVSSVTFMVECTPSECYTLSLNSKKITFCWNGFCSRDCLNIQKPNGVCCPACSLRL
jgi:hypothetical protein